MKKLLLIIAIIALVGTTYSQNVNYICEVVDYYATGNVDDGFGSDEECTWKSWGKDNANIGWTGGVCEPKTGNTPLTNNTLNNIVLIADSNTSASFITLRLEAWEDDNVVNGYNDPDRCTYDSGDDYYIYTTFTPFDFRTAAQCEWKEYSFTSGEFRLKVRVIWEYTGLTAQSPITGCDNTAELQAFGSGEWTEASAFGATFTDNLDPNTSMNGVAGTTYQLNWSQLPTCINDYGTQSVTVNMLANPVPGLTTSSNLCENGDLIFTANNGVSYDWATGTVGNVINTTSNGLDTIFNVTSSDLPIFVTVTDANGCSASESWSSALTSGPAIDLGNDTTICVGTTAELDAFAGLYTYSWNNGETASIIYPSSSGQYIVEVTDFASGCSGYDTINVSQFPPSNLYLGADIQFCIGDTVVLDAGSFSSFVSYSWSSGSTNQVDTITSFGEVYVTAIDANTCLLSDTINFSPEYNYSSLIGDTVIYLGNSIELIGPDGVSYVWNTGETTQNIIVAPIENTSYEVTTEMTNGCYEVMNANIIISDRLNFFIPNMFSPNDDGANDTFNVYGNGIESISFNIYNRWGELVYQVSGDDAVNEIKTIGWDGKHNGIDQPTGTYVWTMTGFTIDGEALTFSGKNTGTLLLRR